MKVFQLYRSSAGSGKTRTLAKAFLKLALKNKSNYYRHILAVTFTNKATGEMKERILYYLDNFARGRPDEMAKELQQELALDADAFRSRSQEVQATILHHYADFSVSTIDAFFQKVIRSFTRESGLAGDYRLEIEPNEVLGEVMNELMAELGENDQLRDWVIRFVVSQLEDDKKWNIKSDLQLFAGELFREEYKMIANQHHHDVDLKELQRILNKEKSQFVKDIHALASDALRIINNHAWSIEDFKYGNSGSALKAFQRLISENEPSKLIPSKRFYDVFLNAENWPSKTCNHADEIIQVADKELIPIVKKITDYYEQNRISANTVEVMLQNFFLFALLSDIGRKLNAYQKENSIMLLSDSNTLLENIIADSDTPFIYEKTGSFYRHYLIDEFQDTSFMQWRNFYPLIANNLDAGHESMVVGDVKQGIYRWRGGNLSLLQQIIPTDIGSYRTELLQLNRNFRSAKSVVEFNNAFFRHLSNQVPTISEVYADVEQKIVHHEIEGKVVVDILDKSSYRDEALMWLRQQVDQLLDKGVEQSDITILVRENSEGASVANFFLQISQSSERQYHVVSNDSLFIAAAASVRLLINIMRMLSDHTDLVAKAQVCYEWAIIQNLSIAHEVFDVSDQKQFEQMMPVDFVRQLHDLRKLSLFDLCESLIRIFNLSKGNDLAYVQPFQEQVWAFGNKERNDITAFLTWWDEKGHRQTINITGGLDAMNVMTIHKSKGLQFPYVLIPFATWTQDYKKNPLLWVNYPLSENSTIPVPIRYKQILAETIWSAQYTADHEQALLDNVNLLYVAFTRAEKGLFAATFSSNNTIGTWIEKCLSDGSFVTHYDESIKHYEIGSLETSKNVKSEQLTDSLIGFPTDPWHEKISIRKAAHTIYGDHPANNEFGILLHEILAKVINKNDWPILMRKLISDGVIDTEQLVQLNAMWNNLMKVPTIASWFSLPWSVSTERSIWLPDGSERRIDRLLMQQDQKMAVVIDYKTGQPTSADRHQIMDYVKVLKNLSFDDVEGYLLYVNTAQVIHVQDLGNEGYQLKLSFS